jgi:hypothetical protein
MSVQIARQMLASTAGRFRLRNTRTSALPDHWLLGQRASGQNALDALLQWAIEIAVRSAVDRASLFPVSNDLRGLRQWGLVHYRYAPFPESVEMTVEFTYQDGTNEQLGVIAQRIVRELPLGGLDVRVSVDVSGSNQLRTFAAAHEDGLEQPGRPSGRVVTMGSTPSSRPVSAQGTNAPQPSANAPQTPGAVLPPNYLFRTYSSSANAPLTPTPGRRIPPPDLFRTYPSSANAPRTPSRPTGHPLGR